MVNAINIKTAISLITTALAVAVEELDVKDRVAVAANVPSIEEYKLNHPKGALLVIYKGDKKDKTKLARYILQDRDIQVGVIIVARVTPDAMQPYEYVDFVEEVLSGLDVSAEREDNKVFGAESEWLKEEGGEWWFGCTFIVPTVFAEKAIVNNEPEEV